MKNFLILLLIIVNLIAAGFLAVRTYDYELVLKGISEGENIITIKYDDLDGDGEKEEVLIKDYDNIYTVLNIGSTNGFVSDLKIEGKIKSPGAILFHDLDSDGIKEILTITRHLDTLRLNYSDLYSVKETHDIISVDPNFSLENYDYLIDFAGVYNKQIIFSINAGYPLTPRAIYSFKWDTKEINRTEDPGSLLLNPYLFDLDKDGIPEIITRSFAPENIHYPVPYSDSSSWLRVFDLHLDHFFEPIEYPHRTSKIRVNPIRTDSSNFLAVSAKYGRSKDINPSISLINESGEIIRERESVDIIDLFQYHKNLYTYNYGTKSFARLNDNLEEDQLVITTEVIPNPKDLPAQNFKPNDAFFYVSSRSNVLSVVSNDLDMEAIYELSEPILETSYDGNKIYALTSDKRYLFSYERQSNKTGWLIFSGLILLQAGLVLWKGRKKKGEKKDKDFIIFKTGDERLKVKFDDIEYLEAAGGPYTNVYLSTQERPLLIVKNIGAIEKELPERFVRISRKHVVEKDKVISINSKTKTVTLLSSFGEMELSISKDRVTSFQATVS
ncbi:LytR/AlgR family response regulator transcription factor [Ekhidna sp.]|uniref:LytR/AlgR family response regulator transcription factor n=1 Tax=Ekhidna sp. TaxID=2608089 RepID=UPI003CCC426A